MNGAPAKPMSGVRAELGGEQPHRLGDVGDVVGGQVAQLGEVGPGADRAGDDRADPGDDVEVDTDRRQRHHDVGEEDRGVDAVAAHRLQGDLGDQVGPAARLEHADALADRAVLGQRPAGLAHEPHRGVRHVLPAGGAHQGGVGGGGARGIPGVVGCALGAGPCVSGGGHDATSSHPRGCAPTRRRGSTRRSGPLPRPRGPRRPVARASAARRGGAVPR